MPKKRFMKKRPVVKKSGYRKKYTKTNNPFKIVANYPGNNVFPRQYICKLKYSDIIQVIPGLSSRDYVFNLNSLQDPDETNTLGTQPRYFDQLSQIYARYRVLGCKMRARYMPTDATVPSQSTWLAYVPTLSSTSLSSSTYAEIAEKPHCKTSINNIYGRRSEINKYISMSTLAGISKKAIQYDDTYIALSGNNPETRQYGHLVVGTLDEASTAIAGRLIVDITYYCSFERPVTPGQS